MAYGREFGALEVNVHKIELIVLKTKEDHEKKFSLILTGVAIVGGQFNLVQN